MGYDISVSGTIPASAVTDRDKVAATLLRLSKQPFADQSQENRYEVDAWLQEDGSIEVSEDTRNWGHWIEVTLQAIAPWISGEHVFSFVGEDGDEWDIILRDGQLYERDYDRTPQPEHRWEYT